MYFSDKTCKNWSKMQKGEYDHRNLHIRISLGIKFQFKLTILNFGPN